jgi:DNA-methyltransferase (dcm)
MKLATVFSGIGAPEWAFKRLGIPYESLLACDNGEAVVSYDLKQEKETISKMASFAEVQKYVTDLYVKKARRNKHNYVQDSYLANYPDFDEHRYFQDAKLLPGSFFKDQVDLFVGGSPCQSFSVVGAQEGFGDDRGNLFFEYLRLVKEIRPKVFIYENVNGLREPGNKDVWSTMTKAFSDSGYAIAMKEPLNAKDYGIPQIRNRIFVIGFLDPKYKEAFKKPAPIALPYKMQDFLISSTEDGGMTFDPKTGALLFSKKPGVVGDSFNLTPLVSKYVLAPGTKNWKTHIETDRPIARTLLSTMGNHHRAGVDNYVRFEYDHTVPIRALTTREVLRLMGFTDDFKIAVPKPQVYKQAGNSMVVDVIMALLKAIIATGVFEPEIKASIVQ